MFLNEDGGLKGVQELDPTVLSGTRQVQTNQTASQPQEARVCQGPGLVTCGTTHRQPEADGGLMRTLGLLRSFLLVVPRSMHQMRL